jgi:hypothetical protein
MKNRPYEEYNAKPVLERLEKMIERGCSMPINQVYDDLSIFDWWPERLTLTHMKQMRTFLREAIKLGYTGYVCFKVGASGCANGMWASTEPTTNGYSPDTGKTLYRSFTPDYTHWSVDLGNGEGYLPKGDSWSSLKTAKQLEAFLADFVGPLPTAA